MFAIKNRTTCDRVRGNALIALGAAGRAAGFAGGCATKYTKIAAERSLNAAATGMRAAGKATLTAAAATRRTADKIGE